MSMKTVKRVLAVAICLSVALFLMTACGSEAKKEMDSAVEAANVLVEKGEKPYDPATLENLEKAIASANEAKDDEAYKEVTANIASTTKEYENSVRQMKQVTNPEESFLIERAETVDTITKVEAATEETDNNKLMNKPGGYTSYIAMQSSMVENEYFKTESAVESGTDGGAAIEAFATAEDAKAREQYLASFDGSGMLAPGSHTVVGTLLIRTSNELTATQQKELEKNIIDALIRLED